ncbi:MAG: hypothetical protein RBS37_13705, partial [Bacteroidales bacterium]|nr:hypothetical protein [Bacteroidales bacterium]
MRTAAGKIQSLSGCVEVPLTGKARSQRKLKALRIRPTFILLTAVTALVLTASCSRRAHLSASGGSGYGSGSAVHLE